MLVANAERGEVEITLEGDTARPLRPSYEAIVAIEKELDTTLQALCARAASISFLQISEVGVIMYHGMIAAGKDRNDAMLRNVQRDKLTRLAFETGVTNLQQPIGQFLINALSGGKPIKKEDAGQTTLTLATGA
jgi:hypothetical protein